MRKPGKVLGAVDNLDGRTEHLASAEAGHMFLNIQQRPHAQDRCREHEGAGGLDRAHCLRPARRTEDGAAEV